MMLVSGNDAAVAVAEHAAGSVPEFARRMTEKARAIGAEHTQFTNSCGLHDPRHFTTAYDLALITVYGYKNPAFRQIVSTKERRVPLMKPPFFQNLENENMLLWIYPGANGVKTGYTDAAGRCVVTAAERDGVQLVSVVLDAVYMWNGNRGAGGEGNAASFRAARRYVGVSAGDKGAALSGGSRAARGQTRRSGILLSGQKSRFRGFDG